MLHLSQRHSFYLMKSIELHFMRKVFTTFGNHFFQDRMFQNIKLFVSCLTWTQWRQIFEEKKIDTHATKQE